MKVAHKFTAALVVIVLATLILRAAIETEKAATRYSANVRAAQRQLGAILHLSLVELWQVEGWEAALQFLQDVEVQQDDVQIRWVWLTDDARPEYYPIVAAETIRKKLEGRKSVVFEGSEVPGVVVTYRPVPRDNLPLGAIELARSTAPVNAYIWSEMKRQALLSVLVLAIYAMVAGLLGRRFIGRPIAALVDHAERTGSGDFSTSSILEGKDEIAGLAQAMNDMSQRLQRERARTEKERTARLEIEKQLTHADRLASVGRLTAGLIHDLGTPLNVISGRAAMIAEGDVPPEKIPDAAQRISDQAMRIAEMIRELLNFARSGDLEVQPTPLASLANEVRTLIQPLADKRKVKIEVASEGNYVASVNRTQMRQVLVNLCMNAKQAMPKGGVVRIRLQKNDDTNELGISVADNGEGIPADISEEQLFEPFFTTKGERQGTGLGLSVCAMIVDNHGGRIEVQSTEGKGATFTLWLPQGATA